ncbi:hypothetical protein J8J14_12220 [Roseomonas sp. SSH11]|uniref:ABM domain-containing protein n=1 Tax=Pararoseomonas baculiformis TaxID=2820812 RepID=A0ABS4AEV5_9PROT|nr:hypothetical protein [Pararoseomonas baculiformis]MBP0445542.1 hypothetical protein [Pararoseomonas baculiformis]
MYLTLRRFAGGGARATDIARSAREGLVPILKRAPGFRGYCAFASEDGDAVAVSLFENEQQAGRAGELALSWVRSDMRDLLPDPPETFLGPIAIQAGMDGTEGGQGIPSGPLYVLIRKFENMGEPDKAEQFTREISVPAVRGSQGFRGFYAAWGDPGRTRAAVVTLFDSRENADRSNQRVLQLIREKGESFVPQPSRVVAGRALVVEPGA